MRNTLWQLEVIDARCHLFLKNPQDFRFAAELQAELREWRGVPPAVCDQPIGHAAEHFQACCEEAAAALAGTRCAETLNALRSAGDVLHRLLAARIAAQDGKLQ